MWLGCDRTLSDSLQSPGLALSFISFSTPCHTIYTLTTTGLSNSMTLTGGQCQAGSEQGDGLPRRGAKRATRVQEGLLPSPASQLRDAPWTEGKGGQVCAAGLV